MVTNTQLTGAQRGTALALSDRMFDMFIGVIQAFIFALFTILYFDTAMADVH